MKVSVGGGSERVGSGRGRGRSNGLHNLPGKPGLPHQDVAGQGTGLARRRQAGEPLGVAGEDPPRETLHEGTRTG